MLEIITIVILLVSLVISIKLVNWLYRVFVSILGAETMFFSVRTKIIWYAITWMIIAGILLSPFGIT